MRALGKISTTALLLLFGVALPAFAQEEHHEQEEKAPKQEQQAKPEKKQQEAKPEKQQQEAKPEKQQQAAKPEKREQQQAKGQEEKQQKQEQQQVRGQEEKQQKPEQQQARGQAEKQEKQEQEHARTQQNQEKNQQRQEVANAPQHEQSQGQWAHDGQKDSHGHVYTESRFGREHHARFEENGGRYYNGYREYSYGGYWFYASSYPAWFYQQDVYFILGADGLWYAVAYNNPTLMFQVYIG